MSDPRTCDDPDVVEGSDVRDKQACAKQPDEPSQYASPHPYVKSEAPASASKPCLIVSTIGGD